MLAFNSLGLIRSKQQQTFNYSQFKKILITFCIITVSIRQSLLKAEISAQELCSTTFNSSHQKLNRSQAEIDTLPSDEDKKQQQQEQAKENWIWKYVDEQTDEFQVMTDDGLVDERLANLNYALNTARAFEHDFYAFNMGDEQVNKHYKKLVAGSRVDDKLCAIQLGEMLRLMEELELKLEDCRRGANMSKQYINQYLNESHHRLAKVLDSFGRYQAGALSGRTHFPGSYGQCQGSQMILNDSRGKTTARYCTARLRVDRHLDSKLRLQGREERQPDNLMFVGICLPESCHSKSFDDQNLKYLIKRLVDNQFKLPKSIFLDENLDIESVYCNPDDDSPMSKLPFSGKLFVVTLSLWFLIMFYVNYRGECPEEFPALKKVFVSLNLTRAWREFTSTSTSGTDFKEKRKETRVQLDTLNPIKAIGCFTVVLGHSLFITAANSMDLLKTYKTLETDPWVSFMTGTTVIVDTFYLITGLLITYITLIKINTIDSFRSASSFLQHCRNAFKLAAVRYLRLVPLYFLVFWFKKSVFIYLGSGPNWDYGFNRNTILGGCRQESWWSPFTMMAAFLPLSNQCLPHCWSVANDIAACFILFPLIILLTRKPVTAIMIGMIISLISSLAMYDSMLDLPAETRNEIRSIRIHAITKLFVRSSFVYTAPQNRVCAVLVGSLAGYALYHYHLNIKLKGWPNWFKGIGTIMSFVTVVLIIGSGATIPYYRKHGLVESMQEIIEPMYSIGRLFWALANAIIFLRMATDWKGNFVMIFSANRFWRTLAMLNYPIFMIHVDVIHFSVTSRTTIEYYSRFNVLTLFAFTYLISITLGTIIHLTLENPIDKLIRSYLFNSAAIRVASKQVLEETQLNEQSNKLMDCNNNNNNNKRISKKLD